MDNIYIYIILIVFFIVMFILMIWSISFFISKYLDYKEFIEDDEKYNVNNPKYKDS